MSQMDISQHEHQSLSDGGDDNDSSRDAEDHYASTAAADADEEFVDAIDSLDHLPATQRNGHESNYGMLERCGRWLMAIPRDDVVALQRTSEYRDFLSAFDRLGEAHRRTVTLERQHLMESEEDHNHMAGHSTNDSTSANNFASTNATSNNMLSPSSPTSNLQNSSNPSPIQLSLHSHPLSPSSALRRRRYSFLQHLAVDDVLLRIFEFIDCSSLVRTGTSCHRFHELTTRSAEQRTHRLVDGRLLRSAMKMLRAQEQIDGVGPREEAGPFVPIPMLGLSRRIKVSGAGDPEYNGIYFCTGSNGNGFLFTKPRSPERRVRVRNTHHFPTFNMQQLVELDGAGGMEHFPINNAAGDINNANNDNVFVAADGAVGLDVQAVADDENNGDDANAADNNQGEEAVDVLNGDEPDRSRLLRCVIAKRFSNETILWYMSKEVEDENSHEISQNFSFWGKLLVTGDATPDVCQYPSQTSILSRNGEAAWQPLTNTVDMSPPNVELLDG